MPRKPKNTTLQTTRTPVATLQTTPPKKGNRKNGTPVSGSTRPLFLRTYELTFGNISQACMAAGISRQTFYRWMASPTRVNERFRERLARMKAEEARIDFLEAAHTELVKGGDTAAVIYGLKTKGRSRGWAERPEQAPHVDPAVLEDVARRFQLFLDDYASNLQTEEDKLKWLERFAERGKVPKDQLAKKVGLLEIIISEVQ